MAASNYNYDNSNPFFSTIDEDVDDATFLKGSRAYQSSTVEQRRQQLMEERRKIEERTIQSSKNSLSLLHQSEEIGNATAQELTRQREQLERTEQKLDGINSSLRTSQKHIQGIKSVFGSIKNYFSGSKSEMNRSPSMAEEQIKEIEKAESALTKVLEAQNTPGGRQPDVNDHPALRMRSEPQNLTSKDVNELLDDNLEQLGSSLLRLKGLGLGLKQELDDQNTLVENITRKAEDVDFRIGHQNNEMNRILKK